MLEIERAAVYQGKFCIIVRLSYTFWGDLETIITPQLCTPNYCETIIFRTGKDLQAIGNSGPSLWD
jgi:hypothetical protein